MLYYTLMFKMRTSIIFSNDCFATIATYVDFYNDVQINTYYALFFLMLLVPY